MSDVQAKPSLLLSYLRLFRLPNVFTAAADVMMGFLLVQGTLKPVPAFLCLVGASCLLYTAGMVLNDVYDIEVDAQQRPERPLPSGQIPFGWARWLGYQLLIMGVVLAWLGGYVSPSLAVISWRSGVVGTALALFVVLYNAVLKKTPLAPLAMGACRFLNVLLGISIASQVATGNGPLGFYVTELLIAGGIGTYIVGVTWYARNEADNSSSTQLCLATGVMLLGIALLGLSTEYYPVEWPPLRLQSEIFWMLLMLLSATIARRSLSAALKPSPQRVQTAVKQCIVSLIMLDAAVTMAVAGPYWGLAVLALIVPMLLLGRWVYST